MPIHIAVGTARGGQLVGIQVFRASINDEKEYGKLV